MRARRYPAIVIAAAALCGVATPACLLTTSLDGFTSSEGSDAALEGASPAVEGGVDGSTTDGTIPTADGGFRCADHAGAVFCADFESEPYDLGFTDLEMQTGGTFGVGVGRSGRGLTAQIPQRGADDISVAYRIKRLDTLPLRTSFTYAYDVLIEDPKGAGVLDYGSFFFNGPYYSASIRSDSDGDVYLHEYADMTSGMPGFNRDRHLPHGVTPGKWTHVTVSVSFTGTSTMALKLSVDDETIFDDTLGGYAYTATPMKIGVGIIKSEEQGRATKISFDDILVTVP